MIEYLPDGEAVLLHAKSGQYFGLDSTGVDMWSALVSSSSVEEAYQILLAQYDVDANRLRADLERLIENLVAHELVKIVDR